MLDWSKLERKTWVPNNPNPNTELCSANKTISRCLLLTDLETQVQQFISEGLEKTDIRNLAENKDLIIKQLERNFRDEDTHFLALNRSRRALTNFTPSIKDYKESEDIVKKWSELPDNPITAAAILELGLFFVILPLYNLYGSTSLKITGKDISGDEQKHVVIHREVAKLLKARPSKQLLNLCEETVVWLAQDIKEETNGKFTIERCVKNSRNLIKSGKSDLTETRVALVNAPFEIANNSMSAYN